MGAVIRFLFLGNGFLLHIHSTSAKATQLYCSCISGERGTHRVIPSTTLHTGGLFLLTR